MSGAGNDFVVCRRTDWPFADISRGRIRLLCARGTGVGVDGLLVLKRLRKDRDTFRMSYYNSDGSRAAFCGNGARCAAQWAYRNGWVPKRFSFWTDSGNVEARIVRGGCVRIRMPEPRWEDREKRVRALGRWWRVLSVFVGVPHAVIWVGNLKKAAVELWGRSIRFHSAFGRQGTNVDFVSEDGRGGIEIRTYERGVERETSACGSGAVASAVAFCLKRNVSPPILCKTASGEVLTVDFSGDGLSHKKSGLGPVWLEGPVRTLFEGIYYF